MSDICFVTVFYFLIELHGALYKKDYGQNTVNVVERSFLLWFLTEENYLSGSHDKCWKNKMNTK